MKRALKKFKDKGEKTGWVYLDIYETEANTLNPGVKKSFRVKGSLDSTIINQKALVPMGDGSFILAVNSSLLKKLGKKVGDIVEIELNLDTSPLEISPDLLECLELEPEAKNFFDTLTPGHQRYFSNWIESAKTIETKTKRITQSLFGLSHHLDYGAMIRHFKNQSNP